MDKIISELETISRLAKQADVATLKKAIQALRDLKPEAALDAELKIWQEKLPVILKEAAGRDGMAKHARHWAEKLKK